MGETELDVMRRMLKWLEFMGRQEALSVVNDALDFDDKEKEEAAKIVYQLSNGDRTTGDIEEHVSYGTTWISDRQQEWATLGILKKESTKSPYEHILSLDDLGISYPDLPEGAT